jgi:multidrug resistance efflux pump
MAMTNEDIEIKTEDVNELLKNVPRGIIRWGNSIFFVLMLIGLLLSFIIKYPDKLTAKVIITTKSPPVTLFAKINGRIIDLRTRNNQIVKQGDILLVIESTADYKSILIVDSVLANLKISSISTKQKIFSLILLLKDIEDMGDLTSSFLSLKMNLNSYKLQMDINPQGKEIKMIESEISQYQSLQDYYERKENLFKEELALVKKDFERNERLFQTATISTKEYEERKREYLAASRTLEDIKIVSMNNKLSIKSLEKNRLQLLIQDYQTTINLQVSLIHSIENIKSEIEAWKRTYLLKASISGTISLFSYWNNNQYLKLGDEVLSIVPTERQEMIAKLILPIKNSGKLSIGQSVNIKLDNYIYQEYGMLRGKVNSISLMPLKETYSVEVSLPNNLLTTYNKKLSYQQEMQGSADIITKDLSLFDRVFYQFRRFAKKY